MKFVLMNKLTICFLVFLLLFVVILGILPIDPLDFTLYACLIMTGYIGIVVIKDKDWGHRKNNLIFFSYISVIISFLLVLLCDNSDTLGRDLYIIGHVFIIFYISIVWCIVSYLKNR